MKKFILYSIAILFVFFFIIKEFFYQNSNIKIINEERNSEVSVNKMSNDKSLDERNTTEKCSEIIQPGISKKLIISQDELNKNVDYVKGNAYRNIDSLIADSKKGVEVSAIALFEIASNCRKVILAKKDNWIDTNAEICSRLSENEIKKPLDILQSAIDKNSAHAKFVYANNSLVYAYRLKAMKSAESLNHAEDLLKKSEIYGKEAAKEGVEEAFLFMSNSYQNGVFGKPDLTLAYAYILPLSLSNKSSEYKKLFKSLESNLSNSELDKAQLIAFGCPVSDSLKSPF